MAPVPRVVGTSELGRRWGVSRQRADQITNKQGFPVPRKLDQGRVWDEDDIEKWEAAEQAAGRTLPGETRH